MCKGYGCLANAKVIPEVDFRNESPGGLHLLDKMLVAMAFLVGRKERMWQIRESGRSLILSIEIETTVPLCFKSD